MTTFPNRTSDLIPPKDKQLLDMALEGKPDGFKVKVYEIVRQFKLDASDAAFLMLIATGRLEVLLNEFPDQFEALFKREIGSLQQEYRKIEQRFDHQLAELKGQVQSVGTTGDLLINGVTDQVKNLKDLTIAQQTQTEENVATVLNLAQKERTNLEREIDRKLEVARREHLLSVQNQAQKLVEVAGETLRDKYRRQLIVPIVLAGLAIFGVGGISGWTIHQGAMGELDPTGPRQLSLKQKELLQWSVSGEGQLAKNLIQWNQPNLDECIARQGLGGKQLGLIGYENRPVIYGSCALWVVPPEKREFGAKPKR